jgi:hypothetical protein
MQNEGVMMQRKWIVTGIFVDGVCAGAALLRPAAIVSGDDTNPAAIHVTAKQ